MERETMRRRLTAVAVAAWCVVGAVLCVTPRDAAAQSANVVLAAVPWSGDRAKPHMVFSGGSVILQAAATVDGLGQPVALQSGTWDPGDGTGPVGIDVSNSRVLELTHTYTGSNYQPFTAVISVIDADDITHTDTFKVQIVPKSLDTEVNMALDRALWYAHKRQTVSAVEPTGWYANIRDALGAGLINLPGNTMCLLNRTKVTTHEIAWTSWTSGGNGGGFAYTRDGVPFQHPNYSETDDYDVIDDGVSLTRYNAGPTVNLGSDQIRWKLGTCPLTAPDVTQIVGVWTDDNVVAATASTLQAMEVNGHRATGDVTKDPYVADVALGLRGLQAHLRQVEVSEQPLGDPDVNGNGYGLESDSNDVVYAGGQVIDAFVASGTPNAVAEIGSEAGRTYKDIVQDLVDVYSYGMDDYGRGGWVYGWNTQQGMDGSSSGWWAVGAHAAEVWGVEVPQWVKNENLTNGVPTIQVLDPGDRTDPNFSPSSYDGSCGYRGRYDWMNVAKAAACLLMMSEDGVSRTDDRFKATEQWIRRQWSTADDHGDIYGMYNLAKAMRLAPGGSITLLGGDIDWYNADINPNDSWDRRNGFARYLVGSQGSDGQLATFGGWVYGTLANAWGALILAPALFEQGPTAACSIDTSTVCRAGAVGGCNTTGTNPYASVFMDGSASSAGDNPIASYAWNFQNGGDPVDATTSTATTTFSENGTYGIQLTVTDTKGHSSSVSCPVVVQDLPLPPVANPGGPYTMCLGSSDSVILDGSGSYGRNASLTSYAWDWTAPVTFATPDASIAAPGDKTAYFSGLGAGVYDIGLRVTDNNPSPLSSTAYTTVTVLAADDPLCVVPKTNPTITTAPSATGIIYGQRLSDSTLSGGVASVPGTFAFIAPVTVPDVGTASQTVRFTPSDTSLYNPVLTTASVEVGRATPAVTTAPSATGINYGQTLADSVLSSGVASVAGTFAFTTPATAPPVGTGSYGVTFTPEDTTRYTTVATTASVTVAPIATTVTTPPTASAITYGSALSASTLTGGVASVPGTFAFVSPDLVPDVGSASQSVLFTPTDQTQYATVLTSAVVEVGRATPTVTTPPTASGIIYGQTLSASTLSGGSASVAGTFAFTSPSTAPTAGTASQDVTFTPTDAARYTTAASSASVTVGQATPVLVTGPTATSILDGEALSASTLSGAANVAGAFAFTAPSTTPPVGINSQPVLFTPTDGTNYTTLLTSADVNVQKLPVIESTPTVPGATPTYGTTLGQIPLSGGGAGEPPDTSATTTGSLTGPTARAVTLAGSRRFLTSTQGALPPVPGHFEFEFPNTVPPAGQTSHSLVFVPDDETKFRRTKTPYDVTIDFATPVVSVAPSAAGIGYGQTLADATLSGGTVSVSGTWAFTTPATRPPAGTASYGVTFTPTDSANYLSTTSTTSVTVTPASLSPNATAANKTYDGTRSATITGRSLTGTVVNGDVVSLTGGSATFDTAAVGTNKTVTVTGLSLTGTSAGNYELTTTTALTTASITARPVSLSLSGTTSVASGSAATYTAVLTDTLASSPIASQVVSFSVGGVPLTASTDVNGRATVTSTVTLTPGSYAVTASTDATSTTSAATSNTVTLSVTSGAPAPTVTGITYTGPLVTWMQADRASTASVTLAATVTATGDVRTSRVTFAIRRAGSYTPIKGAQDLPLTLVSGADVTVGTVSKTVVFDTALDKMQQYQIAVIVTGTLTLNDPAWDQLITVAARGTDGVVGAGTLSLRAAPASSGTLASHVATGDPGDLKIATTVQTKRGSTETNGDIALLFTSYDRPNGTTDTVLHTYLVTATNVLNLSTSSGGSRLRSKATVFEITNPLSRVTIDSAATLDLSLSEPGSVQGGTTGRVTAQVVSKSGSLLMATGWSSNTAQPKPLLRGTFTVK